jgi:hypothetical protein
VWPFPETTAIRGLCVNRRDLGVLPRVRVGWTEVRTTRRMPASSAVGDAFRSRPAQNEPSAFHRVSQRPPLHRHPCWSPLPRACARFGTITSRHRARSVLAVPPGLDGFLLHQVRGLVASRIRSWGSSGFHATMPHACDDLSASSPMPALQSLPLPRSGPHVTVVPCPPVVARLAPLRLRGLVPLGNPLRQGFVAESPSPVALLGFPSWSPT